MEQRRLGLITKAVLTVPGHCLAQCAREFLALDQDQIAQLVPRLGADFAFESELAAKRAELEDIDADLARDKEAEEPAAAAAAAAAQAPQDDLQDLAA